MIKRHILLPQAFIFDLDGTLISSNLDFTAIKAEVGCPDAKDLLEFVSHLPASAQQQAMTIIGRHELADAEQAQWIDGAQQFVNYLREQGLPLAIVTRNARRYSKIKIANNNVPINNITTREDAPPKPDPTGLLHWANAWQIAPCRIAYVGDYLYDIQAAKRAGMQPWVYQYPSKDEQIEVHFDCFHDLLARLRQSEGYTLAS